MAKLTGTQAVRHLAYIERQRAAGKMTARLEEIAAQRQAFLLRTKCCVRCGRRVENKESLKAWRLDHLGPECRAVLMQVREAS